MYELNQDDHIETKTELLYSPIAGNNTIRSVVQSML